ncbi:Anthranilate phosphoribosyltransferase [Candidatus Gugararchaeum adminiculabundum]|nr:Anthranilate phosphoribosyltransferase [Candidatus Gugararchaeum adminiculabundum]
MITEAIGKLVERKNLGASEAEEAMREIMRGGATEAQIAGFLVGLRMKGETIEEIAAFARVMRENCVKVDLAHVKDKNLLIDTCGTGGDKIKTFNVSTCVAFVLAGAGMVVAKHGNRAITSKAGSADVLEALGVNLNLEAGKTAALIEKVGIAFLFAPLFHPAMKYAGKTRKDLEARTVFNLLGPLTNPFGAKRQVVGVYDDALVEKVAGVLVELGCEHGFVVHGVDGLDEVSVVGKTNACEILGGKIRKCTFSPEDFGVKKASVNEIAGGDAKENAKIIVQILKGVKGAKRDIVIANSALALIAADKVKDTKEGARMAQEIIDSGKALEKLKLLVKESNGDTGKLGEFL